MKTKMSIFAIIGALILFGITSLPATDGPTDVQAQMSALRAELADLRASNDDLRTQVNTMNNAVMHLLWITEHLDRVGDDVFLTGANLHIRNGLGATHTTNGLGNIIIGYNESFDDIDDITKATQRLQDELAESGVKVPLADLLPDNDGITDVTDRSGSHVLVVGSFHQYSSYGGIVVGLENEISGIYASVTGGRRNKASEQAASVSGGIANEASAFGSSVSGGQRNIASGAASSVGGGGTNEASGPRSFVSGGEINKAGGSLSSVCGGFRNEASGVAAFVSGGQMNIASGLSASVSGGTNNTASGENSHVSEGCFRTVTTCGGP